MKNCFKCQKPLEEKQMFEKLTPQENVEFYCIECVNNSTAFFKKHGEPLITNKKRR